MSDTPNDSTATPVENENKKQSPWVMLTSLLLLIVGLLLTSFMLLYYAWQRTDHAGFDSIDLTRILHHNTPKTAAHETPASEPTTAAVDLPAAGNHVNANLPASGNEKVKWPKIKLSGFGTSSDGSGGFAIINGEQVLQGGSVGKITLLEVHAHAVILEYMGEQKSMTMGMDK